MPAAPPASVDVLSQLQGCSWRGISFPALTHSVKGGHRLAPHIRMDRDGERVENTGRQSYSFHFKAPMINTIAPGRTEAWASGALFPGTYFALIAALEDRSTGAFVHPIYGSRTCKVASWEDTLDADFRGGPVLVVSLQETVDSGDAASAGSTSNVSVATSAALNLDAAMFGLVPPPWPGTPPGMSLSQFVNSIKAIGDQADLFKQQIAGKIDSVINQMTSLGQIFAGTPGFSDNTQRLISSLHNIKVTALAQDRLVSVYVVAAPSTLASVANRVGATVKDLLVLNPALGRNLIVPTSTVIRFYSK